MFKSIQSKIMLAIVMVTVSVLIVTGYISVYFIQSFTRSETEDTLKNKAELMSEIFYREANALGHTLNEDDFIKISSISQQNGIALIKDKNNTINYYDSDIPYKFTQKPSAQHIYKNKKDYVSGVAKINGSKYMKGWYVICEKTYSSAYAKVNNLMNLLIVLITMAFIILWILGKRLSFTIQRPIKKLSIEANQIAEGDISHGISTKENDELQIIAESFNKMLDNLKATMRQVLDKSGEAVSMHEVMEYVEQTYDELPTGILSVNNIGEITTFNTVAETLTGLNAKDIVGVDIKNPTPTGIRNLIKPINRCLSRGSLQLKTVGDINNSKGYKVPIEYSINIQFGMKNEVLGVICVFRSISDIERFEESAERSKNLGALGEMAANIAHEIKNPLASIRGYTQLVTRDLLEKNMETEELDIIMHEVDRLTVMLDKFLKFARPEKPKLETTDIRDLIKYVIKLMENEKPENIIVNMSLKDVPMVRIDKRQFEPLILNLLLNAQQAMPSGGKIDVRTRYVSDRNMVKVEIQDDGPGIATELSDKIFQPFFTTKDEGTGLGLPICSRTVEAHKGILEVESVEGEMTKFTIMLQGDVNK